MPAPRAATPAPAPAQRLQLAPRAGIGYRAPGIGWNGSPAIPSEVVVRFRDDVSGERRNQLVAPCGCRMVRADPASGYALVRVRDNRMADMIGVLAQRPEVLTAEPNYRRYFMDQSYYDPYEW